MKTNPACLRAAGAVLAAAVLLPGAARAQHYTVTQLVTNSKGDAKLVNGWGISRSSTSPWWVSDNGTGFSTLYDGSGKPQPLIVTVPGNPTATVFNGTTGFEVAPSKPARFLFASEDGTISGWNPQADPAHALVAATTAGAVYKGLAIATISGKSYLYAADFHNGRIDVFDPSFNRVNLADNDLDDANGVFSLRHNTAGLAPFNVQNIGGNLIVCFAKQDAGKHGDVAGPGNGAVAAFTPSGRLIRTFEHVDALNSPWGVALAPADFGAFSHHLLVGQFGGGGILAYNVLTGRFAGALLAPDGTTLSIPGVWGIGFGSGTPNSGPANTLFFAAGPDGQKNGVFGTVTPVTADLTQGNGN